MVSGYSRNSSVMFVTCICNCIDARVYANMAIPVEFGYSQLKVYFKMRRGRRHAIGKRIVNAYLVT